MTFDEAINRIGRVSSGEGWTVFAGETALNMSSIGETKFDELRALGWKLQGEARPEHGRLYTWWTRP